MKIAIIGDGISGLSIARHLCKSGYSPTLFSSPATKSRASDAAQGVICNKGLLMARSDLFLAKLNSLYYLRDLIEQLEQEAGEIIERNFSGVFEPYQGKEDFKRIVSRVYKGEFWGLYRCQHLPEHRWQHEENRCPSLFYPGEGWFNVRHFMSAYRSILKKHKVVVQELEITRIEEASGKVFIIADELRESFDRVILANGFGMKELCINSNIPLPKLKPASGHTLRFDLGNDYQNSVMVSRSKSLILHRKKAYLGSSTIKNAQPNLDEINDSQRSLLQCLDDNFPSHAFLQQNSYEALYGVRALSQDRSPFWGSPTEEPWSGKVYMLGGMYKSGLQLADFLAKGLHAELIGERPEVFAQAFHLSRFS